MFIFNEITIFSTGGLPSPLRLIIIQNVFWTWKIQNWVNYPGSDPRDGVVFTWNWHNCPFFRVLTQIPRISPSHHMLCAPSLDSGTMVFVFIIITFQLSWELRRDFFPTFIIKRLSAIYHTFLGKWEVTKSFGKRESECSMSDWDGHFIILTNAWAGAWPG